MAKQKKTPKEKVVLKNKPFASKAMMKAVLDRRIRDGWSLSEAAAIAGLSKSGLHGIEAKGTCNLDALVKVCNWLEVPVQHFFS